MEEEKLVDFHNPKISFINIVPQTGQYGFPSKTTSFPASILLLQFFTEQHFTLSLDSLTLELVFFCILTPKIHNNTDNFNSFTHQFL